MSFDPAAFMDDFRTEAGEHLRALDRHLLALERDPSDSQLIRQMFLSAHTIKGGAAMLEVADVRELAHALEDVLAQLRQSPRRLDPSTADLLFAAVDGLRALVDRATPGGAAQPSTKLVVALRERARQLADPPPTPAPRNGLPRALAMAGAASYQLVVTGLQNRGVDGLELLVALRDRAVPVIVTTSNDDPEKRRSATELGAFAFLAKGSLSDMTLATAARDALRTTHVDGGADT